MRGTPIVWITAGLALFAGGAWLLVDEAEPRAESAHPVTRRATNDLRPEPDPSAVVTNHTERELDLPVDATPDTAATLDGQIVFPDGTPATGFRVRVRYPAPIISADAARRGHAPPQPRPWWDRDAEEDAEVAARMRELAQKFQAATTVRATCDNDGRFHSVGLRAPAVVDVFVDVPDDSELLSFELDGVILRAGAVTTLPTITLETGARIEGVVVDSFNAPIANASVRSSDKRSAKADRAGRFRFKGLPGGTVLLEASHDETFASLGVGARVRAVRGKTAFARIVLPRAMSVSGRVVDASGRAIDDAKVTVRFEVVGANGLEIRASTASSHSSGAFDAGGIRAGAPCLVSAERLGYVSSLEVPKEPERPRSTFVFDAPPKVDAPAGIDALAGATDIVITLYRLPRVIVRCIDAATHKPMTPDSITLGDTTFDAKALEQLAVGIGSYQLPHDGSSLHAVSLRCRRVGFIEDGVSVTLRSNDVDASDVILVRGPERVEDPGPYVEIVGVVMDASSCVPIANATVEAVGCLDRWGQIPTAKTDRDGEFLLVVAAADVNAWSKARGLRATAYGFATSGLVRLRPETSHEIGLWPFSMKPHSGTLYGGVIGRDGRPAVGLAMTVDGRMTLTNESGLYRFDDLELTCEVGSLPSHVEPWITYMLRERVLADPDHPAPPPPREWGFAVTSADPVAHLDLDLRPLTGSLRGTVHVNDVPAPDAKVEIVIRADQEAFVDPLVNLATAVVDPLLTTTTAADGTFAFPLLLPLEGRLRVTRNSRPVADAVGVRVNYGDDATVEVAGAVADIGGIVRGITPNSDDLPIVRIERKSTHDEFSDATMAAADGAFSFLDVPAGTYVVTARSLHASANPQVIEVTGNGAQTIGIDLDPAVRVVLDALCDDITIDRARLVVDKKIVAGLPLVHDLHGRLVIDDLPVGSHMIEFSSPQSFRGYRYREARVFLKEIAIPANVDELVLEAEKK